MKHARISANFALSGLLAFVPTHANAQSHGLGAESQAFVTQIGDAQRAAIEQHNIYGGLLNGAIQQNGIGNNAAISLEGGNLSGSIVQSGNDNQATLEIRDEHNRGTIEQYGDSNSAGLRIDGHSQDVTLIQQGNGHAYTGPIRVGGDTPGGGPITIRQR
jgi:hypothetical protein